MPRIPPRAEAGPGYAAAGAAGAVFLFDKKYWNTTMAAMTAIPKMSVTV